MQLQNQTSKNKELWAPLKIKRIKSQLNQNLSSITKSPVIDFSSNSHISDLCNHFKGLIT